MGQTSVGRLHGRLDVLQTSFPPSPSWIQDGEAGNDVIQDLGRVFRSPLRRRRKMAANPLPVAILDDLICGNQKWGHPRWRPEAEGPPFSSAMGVEKRALYYSGAPSCVSTTAAHSCVFRTVTFTRYSPVSSFFLLAVSSPNNVYQLLSRTTIYRLYNNISQMLLLYKYMGVL